MGDLDAGSVFSRLGADFDERGFRALDAEIAKAAKKTEKSIIQDLGAELDQSDFLALDQELRKARASTAKPIKQKVEADVDQASFDRARRQSRGLGQDVDFLGGRVARANSNFTFFGRTIGLLKWPALIAGAGGAAQAVSALTGGVVGLTGALGPGAGALIAYPAALGALGQGLGATTLAFNGVGDALGAYEDQQASAATTTVDAAADHRAAAEQIRAAELAVQSAERQSREATQDLTSARADARRELEELREAVSDYEMTERRASLSVQQAKANLARTMRDPESSRLDIAEARLELREAQEALKDTREEGKGQRAELERARKRGVEGSSQVVAAERAIAEATRAEREAVRQLTIAQRDATEEMATGAATVNQYQQALDELSPSARRFVGFLVGLKPLLAEVRSSAGDNLFPGLEAGTTSALRNFPRLQRVLDGTARVVGNLARRGGELVGSGPFGRDFEVIGAGNAQVMGRLGNTGMFLGDALRHVMVAGQPLLDWMGRMTAQWAHGVDESAKLGREQGRLEGFFEKTRAVLERVFSIGGNVAGAFREIGEAGAPLGRDVLADLDQASAEFERWTESMEGRNTLREYFTEAKEPLYESARLVRDVVKAFFELGQAEGLPDLIRKVRTELLPAIVDVVDNTTEAFGPALIDALTSVVGLIGRLADHGGPLTLYVQTLGGLADVMSWFIDNVPGTNAAATALFTFGAAAASLQLVGKWTGITKGLELAFGPKLGERLRGRLQSVMKSVLLRTTLAANIVGTWAADMGSSMVRGLGQQLGKLRAAGRRLAMAFLNVFIPQMAASMAAGGTLGEVIGASFRKLGGLFRTAGRRLAIAFLTIFVPEMAAGMAAGGTLGEALSGQFKRLGPLFKGGGRMLGRLMGAGIVAGVLFMIPGLRQKIIDSVMGEKLDASPREELDTYLQNLGSDTKFFGTPNVPGVPYGVTETTSDGDKVRWVLSPDGEWVRGSGPDKGIGTDGKRHPLPDQKDRRDGDTQSSSGNGRRRRKSAGAEDAEDTRKRVTDSHKRMRKDAENETDKLQKSSKRRFADIRRNATIDTRKMRDETGASFKRMRGDHDSATSAMRDATSSRFSAMVSSVLGSSTSMNEDLASNVQQMRGVTKRGMQAIEDATLQALSKFGIKDAKLSLTGTKDGKDKPDKKARGGVMTVPGTGLEDNVYLPEFNALVAPGENLFAANRHQQPLLDIAVANTFGVGGLDDFFATFNRPHYMARGGRAPRRFAGGGMVDVLGDTGTGVVASSIADLVSSYVRRFDTNVNYGYDPGGGHESPGHNFTGTATDTGPRSGIWTGPFEDGLRLLSSLGFEVLYGTDGIGIPWPNHGRGNHAHTEWAGNGTAPDARIKLRQWLENHGGLYVGSGGSRGPGGSIKVPTMATPVVAGAGDSTFGLLAQAALERVNRGANAYVSKKAKASGGMGGLSVPVGPVEQMAHQMVRNIWGDQEWPPFYSLEMAEAGFNPRAENPDSGAAGLAQALPPSKYPAGAWPYTGPRSAQLQLQWMMRYIKERYGTPSGAWAWHQGHNWYAKGGRIRRFAGGGRATDAQPRDRRKSFKGNINHTFPEQESNWAGGASHFDTGGWKMPGYVIAALAQAAGMPGRTMEQVTRGESGGRPGSSGIDPSGKSKGWGMWAVTVGHNGGPPIGNEGLVAKYGGAAQMLNPVKNAAAAAEIYKASGGLTPSNWYGVGHVQADGLQYNGAYDIRNALGGLSFKDALAGRKPDPAKPFKPISGLDPATVAQAGPSLGLAQSQASYEPSALLKLAKLSGISIPTSLRHFSPTMNAGGVGMPAWQWAKGEKYNRLARAYVARVRRYLKGLAESKKAKLEGMPVMNSLSGFTPVSAEDLMISRLRHEPIAGDQFAYGTSYGLLGGLDASSAQLRAQMGETFDPNYLASYKKRLAEMRKRHAEQLKKPMTKRQRAALAKRFAAQESRVFKPVYNSREAIEAQFASLSDRSSELQELLYSSAAKVRSTANVSRAWSRASSTFAGGGRVGAPAAAMAGGAPVIELHFDDPQMAALFEAIAPQVRATVRSEQQATGSAAGQRRAKVSSTGKRVSYR